MTALPRSRDGLRPALIAGGRKVAKGRRHPMRNLVKAAIAAATLSVVSAPTLRAQPALRACFALDRYGQCIVGNYYDPYGLDRFQAAQHNSCATACNASFSTCMMSYVPNPSPIEDCRRAQALCAQSCP